jgi:CO/xanthine dehydrogenase Mo-binding subunit
MGVSAYFGGSLIYPNSSSVTVKMNDDGTATLLTGALDIGQGAETVLCQIVAEELKIPVEEIRVIAADTDTTRNGECDPHGCHRRAQKIAEYRC